MHVSLYSRICVSGFCISYTVLHTFHFINIGTKLFCFVLTIYVRAFNPSSVVIYKYKTNDESLRDRLATSGLAPRNTL
jgi:hypothetical protein